VSAARHNQVAKTLEAQGGLSVGQSSNQQLYFLSADRHVLLQALLNIIKVEESLVLSLEVQVRVKQVEVEV